MTPAPSPFRHGSLGLGILLAAAAQAFILLVAMLFILQTTARIRSDVERATVAYVEEQAIASRITGAVTRQLVAAAASPERPDPALHREFHEAGDEAHEQIRTYLFRDLSPDHRLQVERIRERHQRMEVAAARALELAGRGATDQALDARDAMIAHGHELRHDLSEFLHIRAAGMERLREQQASVFRYLHVGLGVIAALIILAMGLMGHFLYRRLALPLNELVAAATGLGAGDLDRRIDRPRGDELGAVADAFNRMADRLAATHEKLRERNDQLEAAMGQLRDTQAELIQTEKLSAVGHMMAGLAHELNNPLASVLGYSQLVGARLADPEPIDSAELARDYVDPIVAEAVRAQRLVQSLLRFAREAETNKPVPLNDALDVAVRLRSYAFEQAGLTLRWQPAAQIHVHAETQRLQQSFLNIINNAYDAMEPRGQGTLTISTRVDDDRATITFEDDGPGFDDLERVFDPFYTTKPAGKGTGLGLVLVQRFAAEMDGRIVAANRPDGGASLALTLNVAPAPEGEATTTTAQPEAPGAWSATGGCGPRILVVEDEVPLQNLQRRLLLRAGASVQLAAHGPAARQLMEAAGYDGVDLVISDVKMPGGGGLDLYRWVEENRPQLVKRFVFVTGDIADPEIATLSELRPEQFICKPFDMNEYVARITAVLANEP